MSSNILEDKWEHMKASARTSRGKITESDFVQSKGKRARFAGIIQGRYGKGKDQAKKEVNDYIDSL